MPSGDTYYKEDTIACPTCKGTGKILCPECRGRAGQVVSCSKCRGEGTIQRKCVTCNGTGLQDPTKEVKIEE
jgi:DnaJ-class molecular chaperone